METPRLSLTDWIQCVREQLVRIQSLLGVARESVKRLRGARQLLMTENQQLRAELKACKAEVDELQQVIIRRLWK